MTVLGDTTFKEILMTATVVGFHVNLATPAKTSGRLALSLFTFFPTATSRIRVYAAEAELVIDEITVASPAIIRTTAPHGLTTGDFVDIRGSDSGTSVDGNRACTVTDATHFHVGVNVGAGAGTEGSVLTKVEDVIGTMDPDDGTTKFPVVLGDGGALVAVAPSVGKGIWVAGTVATNAGGGMAKLVELPGEANYAGSAFG
jgi:hypothetical protein